MDFMIQFVVYFYTLTMLLQRSGTDDDDDFKSEDDLRVASIESL